MHRDSTRSESAPLPSLGPREAPLSFSSLPSVIVATSELKEEEQNMTISRGMVATLDEAHTRAEAATLGWGGN